MRTTRRLTKNTSYSGELKGIVSRVAEPIERLIERKKSNQDTDLGEGAALIYTERKDGVIPAYNIRTDKWEMAQAAREKVAESAIRVRDAKDLEKQGKKRDSEGKVIDLNPGGEASHTDGTK